VDIVSPGSKRPDDAVAFDSTDQCRIGVVSNACDGLPVFPMSAIKSAYIGQLIRRTLMKRVIKAR
jgi:hypothetical protein